MKDLIYCIELFVSYLKDAFNLTKENTQEADNPSI